MLKDNLEDSADNSSTKDESTTPLDAETQVIPEGQESASESSNDADAKEVVNEENWDPLSVVKKAVSDDQDSEVDSDKGADEEQLDESSQSEKDGQKSEGTDAEDDGEVTEEELKGYKPTTRKRVEKLLDDRQRLNERVEVLEPAAQQMEQFQNFMSESDLVPKEVTDALITLRMGKSGDLKDKKIALENAKMFVSQLETQLGEVLPQDLQDKVDEGHLTPEGAKEVSQARAQTQHADMRVQKASETVEQNQKNTDSERATQAIQHVQNTISDWQQQKVSTDPDFARKAELLQKEIKLRIAGEPGGTVLDANRAVKIAEEAYTEVGRIIKLISPQKVPEAKRMMQSKAINKGNVTAKPNSPLDAAKAGLERAQQ